YIFVSCCGSLDFLVTVFTEKSCQESLILHISAAERLSLFMAAFGMDMIAKKGYANLKQTRITGCLKLKETGSGMLPTLRSCDALGGRLLSFGNAKSKTKRD